MKGWLAFIILVGPARGLAHFEAETSLRQYDDTKTKVFSPSLDLSQTFNNEKLKVKFGHTQDILSSASSDVVTFSSQGSMEDNRREFSGGLEAVVPDANITMGFVLSDEDDYHSKVFSAGGTRDFYLKNTTLSFGFANGYDTIGSSADSSFEQSMRHQVYSLGLAQVINRKSVVQLIYDLRIENGYIASPYRRAKVLPPSNVPYSVSETHPTTRNRNAWGLKLNRYFESLRLATATTYRLYQDSWGIFSHTIEERLTANLSQKWSLSLSLRYYLQTAARFYRDYYSETEETFFRTGNATLGDVNSYLIGIRPVYAINDRYKLTFKFELYRQSYKNVSEAGSLGTLTDDRPLSVNATVFGLGLITAF